MPGNSKTLHERINESVKGGHYRFRGEPEENVFFPGGLEYDAFGRPQIRIWYVIKQSIDIIPFNKNIQDDLEVVPVTEIDKIRARYEQKYPESKESKILDFQAAKAAQEKAERAKQHEEIAHLADHLSPEKK